MIWRRLLVRSGSTIADLHHTRQIAFGWSDAQVSLFHDRWPGLSRLACGGIRFSCAADQVRWCDFKFRNNARFIDGHGPGG